MLSRSVIAVAVVACSFGCFDAAFVDDASCDSDVDCPDNRVCALRSKRCVFADDVAPNVPGDVRVVDIGGSSVAVVFVAPGDDGNVGLVDVVSAVVVDDAGAERTVTGSQPRSAGSEDRLAVGGLTPATRYTVTVRAEDDVGNVAASDPVAFATAGDLACDDDDDCAVRAGALCRANVCTNDRTAPSAPADPRVDLAATTQTSVRLVFGASGDDGLAGRAARYTLALEDVETGVALARDFAGTADVGSDEAFVVDGLTRGHRYRLSVRAVDDADNASSAAVVDVESGGFYCRDSADGVAILGAFRSTTASDQVGFIGCTTLVGDVVIDDSDCELDALFGLQSVTTVAAPSRLTYIGGGSTCRRGLGVLAPLAALTTAQLEIDDTASVRISLPAFTEGALKISRAPFLASLDAPSAVAVDLTLEAPSLQALSFPVVHGDLVVTTALERLDLPRWSSGDLELASAATLLLPLHERGNVTVTDPHRFVVEFAPGRGGQVRGPRNVDRLLFSPSADCTVDADTRLVVRGLIEATEVDFEPEFIGECASVPHLAFVAETDFDADVPSAVSAFGGVSGSAFADGFPRAFAISAFSDDPPSVSLDEGLAFSGEGFCSDHARFWIQGANFALCSIGGHLIGTAPTGEFFREPVALDRVLVGSQDCSGNVDLLVDAGELNEGVSLCLGGDGFQPTLTGSRVSSRE